MSTDPFQQLRTLHFALATGSFLFLAVTIGFALQGNAALPFLPAEGRTFPLIGGGVSVALLITAFSTFRSLLVRLGEDFESDAVEQRVRKACIVHWALLDVAIYINILLCFILPNMASILFAVIGLLVLCLRRPTRPNYDRWRTGEA